MKRFILVIAILILVLKLFSQTNYSTENKCEKYIVSELLSIEIPTSLEIQRGNYKILSDNIKKAFKVNTSNAVFQPKGLNDFSKIGKTKYARVMINISRIEEPIPELSINSDIKNISKDDIKSLDDIFQENFKKSISKGVDVKIVRWFGTDIFKLNNMTSIKVNFTRKMQEEPSVNVTTYYFYKDYHQYEIILSCREVDMEYWRLDFEKILKSIKLL